jgi:putative ABC transport system permease protein
MNQSSNYLMFWRLLRRALSVKRPQALLAIVSLAAGAAVTAMLLNLYGDVQRKMSQEFRAYGANVVLAPGSPNPRMADLAVMDADILGRLKPFQDAHRGLVSASLLYVVVRLRRIPPAPRLPEVQNVVAVGTEFSAFHDLYPRWRLDGSNSPSDPATCVLGANIAAKLRIEVGQTIELESAEAPGTEETRRQRFRVATLVRTGASEDDQVIVPLPWLERWAGLDGKLSAIELRVPGTTADIERAVAVLSHALPGVEVRPVRQIVYSEGKVLGTLRGLVMSLAVLILVIIALCVTATMTAIVLERRRDMAVMKALGASDRMVIQLFLSEGAGMGLIAGVVGFVLGIFLAKDLAQRLFGVTLNVLWWTFPVVCLSSAVLAVMASIFPVGVIRGIRPAVVLKGE